jgi:hypothetical protein
VVGSMLLDSAAFVLCLEFSATPGSCFVSVWLKSIAGLLQVGHVALEVHGVRSLEIRGSTQPHPEMQRPNGSEPALE